MKKKTKSNYWKIIKIILFFYIWMYLNTFIHELGHAFAALLLYNCPVTIFIGKGWKIKSFIIKKITIDFSFPMIWGFTKWRANETRIVYQTFLLLSGLFLQSIFLYSTYFIIKKVSQWKKKTIGNFLYKYGINLSFWLTFLSLHAPGGDLYKFWKLLYDFITKLNIK
jgi:hypothetical protein